MKEFVNKDIEVILGEEASPLIKEKNQPDEVKIINLIINLENPCLRD